MGRARNPPLKSALSFVRREPLLVPFVCLATGILLAHLLISGRSAPATTFSLAGAAILAFSLTLCRSYPRVRLAILGTTLVLAGLGTQMLHRRGPAPRLDAEDGEAVLLSGCVVNPPVFSPQREQFTLDLARNAAVRISVNLKTDAKVALAYGQKVEVAAKVRLPRNFQNPDSFDYVSYLAAQHIFWTGSVAGPGDIHVVSGRCGSRAVAMLYAVRTWALERIRALYPDDPHTVALLQATLIGETAGVDRRWTSDFRVTGTYHALVISGQHVSVLAFTLLLLFRLIRVRRLPALALATVVCWLYAFISGFSSPVVRAAGGFTLFLAASYLFRRTRILNLLAAVGIIYLLLAPEELYDPSFQLSFLSAAAIAAFAIPLMQRTTEPLREAVKRFDQRRYDPQLPPAPASWRVELRLLARTLHLWTGLSERLSNLALERGIRLAVFVADAVIVSACVQFALALPMIAYFHRLSVTGLSANIVIVPLLSLIVPLGFACILTGFAPLAVITRQLLLLAEWIASRHASFEPNWRQGAIPLSIALAFAASLIVLAYVIRRRPRWVSPALACSLVLFALVYGQPWKALLPPGQLEVSAIDVGQGDSLLIAFPDGETMLVDAGGFPGAERMVRKPQLDLGEDVVAPYLWSRRIRHLDYAVLTHGHSDHMGGLPAILDDFRPKQLWVGAEPDTAEWRNVEKHAAADGVRIRPMNRNTGQMKIGGVEIRVLAPSPDYVPGENATNNDSLVFEIRYGKRSVLLTGDAERAEEADMLASGELQAVTLLKIGHHGSKTSSSEDFLSAVQPKFAFISDGYKNQFHHPSGDVLARLATHQVSIFRTDQRGLLSFRTDGNRVDLNAFR
ncbi:MAG TPA: ComEC/Rec2 family competence protein [Bryobacteraceae bacterium]|nr:ComEC/Rec2 family competence protein [Bryobacteraceae bacterium]